MSRMPLTLLARLPALFAAEHERTYGFRAPDDEPVELIGLSVMARGTPDRPRLPDASRRRGERAAQPPDVVAGCRLGRNAGGGSRGVVVASDRAVDCAGVRCDVPGAGGRDGDAGCVRQRAGDA